MRGGVAQHTIYITDGKKSRRTRETLPGVKNPNTCKACALGMGGSSGGMIDEVGHTLQVCKKSMQAQVQDMQPAISDVFFQGKFYCRDRKAKRL